MTRPLIFDVGKQSMPASLRVDVRADAIELEDSGRRLVLPRGRSGASPTTARGSRVISVPGGDQFTVWMESLGSGRLGVFARRKDVLSDPWLVLEIAREQAVSDPLVVGDRVAVLGHDTLIHAPLEGGAPSSLALAQRPKRHAASATTRLIWIAERDERELVLSTDATLTTVSVEFEVPRREAELLAAAMVGDTLVVASVENQRSYELVLQRRRADATMVELLRRPTPSSDLRLLADGTQAWLYVDEQLWWIGPHSHAKVHEFEQEVGAIAADDGLLVWQLADGIHVAGQPTPEFLAPFVVPVAIGGDDGDPFAPLTAD